MTVDELQEFIENNLYADVSNKDYNDMMTDAQSMDLYSFNNKWGDFLDKNSDGWTTMKKDFKPVAERIRLAFGSSDKKNPFRKDQNSIEEIYKKEFSDDVSREQFDNTLSNMANYWDDEKQSQEYEAGREKRKQEVKDWGWRNALASEYEQQRYIDDPNKALFGKEAPTLGNAPETRGWALADLGLGAAGVAADVGTSFLKTNPVTFGIASVTGPSIRSTRDLLHYNLDDEYKKDLGTIAKDFRNDVLSNASIEGLANARQLTRMVKNTEGNVGKALRNRELIRENEKLTNKFGNADDIVKTSNSDLYLKIDNLPQSQLKTNLKQYAPNIYEVDKSGIIDEINRMNDLAKISKDENLTRSLLKDINEEGERSYKIGIRPYESDILVQKPLTTAEKIGVSLAETGAKIPDKIGPLMKAGTVAGRSENVDESVEAQKKKYKQIFTRDWLNGEDFKPSAKEQAKNTPKWQAYKEWYYDTYGGYPLEDE